MTEGILHGGCGAEPAWNYFTMKSNYEMCLDLLSFALSRRCGRTSATERYRPAYPDSSLNIGAGTCAREDQGRTGSLCTHG